MFEPRFVRHVGRDLWYINQRQKTPQPIRNEGEPVNNRGMDPFIRHGSAVTEFKVNSNGTESLTYTRNGTKVIMTPSNSDGDPKVTIISHGVKLSGDGGSGITASLSPVKSNETHLSSSERNSFFAVASAVIAFLSW